MFHLSFQSQNHCQKEVRSSFRIKVDCANKKLFKNRTARKITTSLRIKENPTIFKRK